MTAETDKSRQAPHEATSEEVVLEFVDATIGALNDPARVMIEGACWKVERGDFWGIGGLQGSGKTDFLMVAAGLTASVRGACRLFGRDAGSGADYDLNRRRLGLVFDGGQLLRHLTVLENVALPIRYHRNCPPEACEAEVDRLLRFTRTHAVAEKRPGDISRNGRQRAGLARALALKPDVLLLDSPLSGLDPRQSRWWVETLAALSNGHEILDGRALTLVVTTQDLHPWKSVARQFGILKRRRLMTLDRDRDGGGPAERLIQEMLRVEPEGD
jgi:ABC-type transporter Mla maintaining outer membrane lipid asymmetry ATPase subunit MlaF